MSDEPAVFEHVIGRFYLCPNGHEFDRMLTKTEGATPFPVSKPCPTCAAAASVKYVLQPHKATEKCPFGQCPLPAGAPQ